MKPLPEVVREMREAGNNGRRALLSHIADWHDAITDHLARLEALASEWEREAVAFAEGTACDSVMLDNAAELRALLSPAVVDSEKEDRQ